MPEPRLTTEQDAELRRLLLQARHDDPLPEDVAQRLDRVLAGLRAGGEPAPVADLGERRDARRARRRTVLRLLVAAAVVLVAGVGIGQVVSRGGSSSDDSAGSSSSSVDRAGGSAFSDGSGRPGSTRSPGATRNGSPPAPAPGSSSSTGQEPKGPSQALRAQLPVDLSSSRLGRDVRSASALAAQQRLQPGTAAIRDPLSGWSCAGTFTVAGDADLVLPARYDGTPALLVLSPTDAGHQRARVLACGTFRTVRSLVVRGS